MTENVLVEVGQCGNQIGRRFWEMALAEHSAAKSDTVYDMALSSFFRNTDSSSGRELKVGSPISSLKARAVLIDMEESVVEASQRSSIGELFDPALSVTSQSGSGNNWAVGFYEYGSQYRPGIYEVLRHTAEKCDAMSSWFIIHSMGGGTGSGLGTNVLSVLADEFPDIERLVTPVYPSEDDDVITSPYNSMLAMRQLTDYANSVMPVDNSSLADITNRVKAASNNSNNDKKTSWGEMNSLVAQSILNVTSSCRFPGSLNVDLNEITMNLVPFPRMHYLTTCLSPLFLSKDLNLPICCYVDLVYSGTHALVGGDPRRSVLAASALIARGKIELSDMRRNISRLAKQLQFVNWNQDGWKVGLCSVAPSGQPFSLLGLHNSTSILPTFTALRSRFSKLYRRKAHLHHYNHVDGFDSNMFQEALHSIDDVIAQYQSVQKNDTIDIPRLSIA
ncbi:unnamed protein product [Oikopleura dioica]|uniref:Tubulin/FtsZ GTPase domain-containing protein n=1 Tax=Oikopleura dioica TaxID=34765 RepID=E4XA64_OIKDI|nr:unnamed protein product [Oikopleura dioica]